MIVTNYRLVVTTVTFDHDERLVLDQIAEKDLRHCADSCVIWEGKGDILTQTCIVHPGTEHEVFTFFCMDQTLNAIILPLGSPIKILK